MAALNISKDYEIIILERKTIGKKLLQTGAGKCNYWNESIDIDKYYTPNKEILSSIISNPNKKLVLDIFKRLGIIPKIKNGYYYPVTENSQTIKNALLNKVKEKALIKEDFQVKSIKKESNKFIVSNEKESLTCDKLILATGSNAFLKDKDYLAYNYLKETNHTIKFLLPALVGVQVEDKLLTSLKGLRIDAELSLIENNKLLKKEVGQLQLSKSGLSGICIFNISSLISRGLYEQKEEVIKINFLPFIKTNSYLAYFNERNSLMQNPKAKDLFETIIDYKLVNALFSKQKLTNEKWNDLSLEKKNNLLKAFTDYKVIIKKTNSLEESQTTTGGVSLKEINPHTMESLLVKDLYIVGELLDVDGICGGFNLAFAFITGYLAGKSI